jgi:superfamily II DNA or RNA helicase
MSQVFRAFPALKSMGENVANFIEGQFSSQKKESLIFDSIFEKWSQPECAGDENTLLGKLVLEGGFGYKKTTHTLDELSKDVNSGIHPILLDMLEDETKDTPHEYTVPRSRKPYTHQEEAFRAAQKGNSILVSAGTGSGKTECFLYPIISDILNETAEQRAVRGIRAIILYPTNALIHSQEERLIEYLNTTANENIKGRPISFCMYNSGLASSKREAKSDFYIIRNREDLPKIATPDQNGIPDIILTNFSMLEYILLREKDFPLLSSAGQKLLQSDKTVFRHLVLDEAHTYTGANATEIALQIRRVLLAMESAGGTLPTVQFYATSATFSGNDDGLRKFAQGLFFNVDKSKISIIKGSRFAPEVPYSTSKSTSLSPELQEKLLQLNHKDITIDDIYNTLEKELSDKTPEALGKFLWNIDIIQKMREWLCSTAGNRSYLFNDLYEKIKSINNNISKELVAILLDIGSLAKFTPKDDTEPVPLLPARWHSAFRKFEGIFACINPNCSAPHCQNHGYRNKFGKLYTTWRETCDCGAPVYPLSFCNGCGEPFVMVQKNEDNTKTTPSAKNIIGAFFDIEETDEQKTIEFLSLTPSNEQDKPIDLYPENHFYKTIGDKCSCGYRLPSGDRRKHFTRTFVQNKPLFTSLVLEGLWPHLPEQQNTDHKAWPSNGRHILTFSDTRQNAAQLAPIMENTFFRNCSYQLIKRLLEGLSPEDEAKLKQLEELKEDLSPEKYEQRKSAILSKTACLEIGKIVDSIANNKDCLNLLGLSDFDENSAMQDRKSMLESSIAYILLNLPPNGVSLENAGIVECVYPGLNECQVPPKYKDYLNDQEWQDLLYICMQSIRQRQAFAFDDNNKYEEDFEAYYDFYPNKTCNILSEDIQKHLIPKIFKDKTKLLLATPRNGDCELEEKLKDVAFEKGWINSQKQIYWEKPTNDRDNKVHPIQFRLRSDTQLFRCVETKKIVFKNIRQYSPNGEKGLEVISPLSNSYPRLHEIINRKNIYSCFAAEHTAQTDVKVNQKIEEQFRNNKLNLLSSTTTMEMGIDVGALSSVMLANTPPTQANYMQRAGRAGRRGEGASLIFTICNASPHDEMFYHSPDWAFSKDSTSPEISFKSRVLLQRAVNAWLVRSICRTDHVIPEATSSNPTDAYSTYGSFFAEVQKNKYLDWLHGKNLLHNIYSDQNHLLRNQIAKLLSGSDWEENFDFESSASFIGRSITDLNKIIDDWDKKIKDLDNEIKNFDDLHQDQSEKWRYLVSQKCQNEINRLKGINADHLKDSTISYLVYHQYFPSHGLPIDVVTLNVMTPTEKKKKDANDFYVEDESYKLTRNRASAIRSFAPGNETVARGSRFMSLGIMIDYRQRFGLTPDKERSNGIMQEVYTCPKCRAIYTERPSNGTCPTCSNDKKTYDLIAQNVIKPESFVTNKIRNQGFKKGVKNPKHARQIIHTQTSGNFDVEKISTFTKVKLSQQCHIHTFNEGAARGFKYCKKCFRVMDVTSDGLNADQIAPARRYCPGEKKQHFWSEPFYLYHNLITEALMVKIQNSYMVSNTPIGSNPKAAHALGIALKRAACSVLCIEEKEIDYNLPTADQMNDCDIILYDTNVGGSGIMQLIADQIDNILIYAIKNILVGDNGTHHSICKGACSQCLINYNTQFLFNDESTSPNRFDLLNSIDYAKIQYSNEFLRFEEFQKENNLSTETETHIQELAETAKSISIVLPCLSSDIFNSYLWHALRHRNDDQNVKFLTSELSTDDDKIIAKQLCKKFSDNSIGVINAQGTKPGIYINEKYFGLLNWKSLEFNSPFDETEDFTLWVSKEDVPVPSYTEWKIPSEIQKIKSIAGETTPNDRIAAMQILNLMKRFIEVIQKPDDIDFSKAISWSYTDNYATRPVGIKDNAEKQTATPITKDACINFIQAIGAGHLLQDRHKGKVIFSAADLEEFLKNKKKYPISWTNVAEEDGEHRKEDIHDRFLRINFNDGKQYVLNLGKGFSCFVLENRVYKKLPGSFSWYIRNI